MSISTPFMASHGACPDAFMQTNLLATAPAVIYYASLYLHTDAAASALLLSSVLLSIRCPSVHYCLLLCTLCTPQHTLSSAHDTKPSPSAAQPPNHTSQFLRQPLLPLPQPLLLQPLLLQPLGGSRWSERVGGMAVSTHSVYAKHLSSLPW